MTSPVKSDVDDEVVVEVVVSPDSSSLSSFRISASRAWISFL